MGVVKSIEGLAGITAQCEEEGEIEKAQAFDTRNV